MYRGAAIFSFFALILVFLFSGEALSQTPPPEGVPKAEVALEPPQPEMPKQVSHVEVKDGLLSVELVDSEFGEALNLIGQKAGFKVEIGRDAFGRKLTTKFQDMDLERGIGRLLSLIREKNFLIHYDDKGAVSKIEVYGEGASAVASTPKPATPVRPPQARPSVTAPSPGVTPAAGIQSSETAKPVQPQRRILTPSMLRQRRMATPPAPPVQAQPQPMPQPEDDFMEGPGTEEPVDEVPYVPPTPSPSGGRSLGK